MTAREMVQLFVFHILEGTVAGDREQLGGVLPHSPHFSASSTRLFHPFCHVSSHTGGRRAAGYRTSMAEPERRRRRPLCALKLRLFPMVRYYYLGLITEVPYLPSSQSSTPYTKTIPSAGRVQYSGVGLRPTEHQKFPSFSRLYFKKKKTYKKTLGSKITLIIEI